jgi:hypothetical protein
MQINPILMMLNLFLPYLLKVRLPRPLTPYKTDSYIDSHTNRLTAIQADKSGHAFLSQSRTEA